MDIMVRGRTTALTNFCGGRGTRGYVFSGSDCREWMDGWLGCWPAGWCCGYRTGKLEDAAKVLMYLKSETGRLGRLGREKEGGVGLMNY